MIFWLKSSFWRKSYFSVSKNFRRTLYITKQTYHFSQPGFLVMFHDIRYFWAFLYCPRRLLKVTKITHLKIRSKTFVMRLWSFDFFLCYTDTFFNSDSIQTKEFLFAHPLVVSIEKFASSGASKQILKKKMPCNFLTQIEISNVSFSLFFVHQRTVSQFWAWSE